MNIILIGFKNCGKTTMGKVLAESKGWRFVDTDHLIEETYNASNQTHLSTCDIYKKEGSDFFRELEHKVLTTLIDSQNTVIATGGGIVIEEKNRDILKKLGTVLYLNVPKEELKKRMNKNKLPAFLEESNSDDSFEEVYKFRKPIYELLADEIIESVFNSSLRAPVSGAWQSISNKR